jgi:hypothetical protein
MGTTTSIKKNTNYVVVVDYVDGQTLEDCFLLGWNNKYDWFDCDTCGWEILTKTGRVKKHDYCCIDIDRWVGVYVGEKESDCRSYSDDGNREGYDCTVCQLIKTENGYDLKPVEDDI